MSGGIKTFKLAAGGYADVPDDQVQSWMQEMDHNGVQFESAQVSPEMTVGDPEVLKTPQQHGASGNWGPDEEMSFMDRFANGAKGYAQDFGKAGAGLVRGLNQSLYQGGADEVAAGARAAGGENFGSALKDEQAQRDQAWNDTPITYGAGRALGYVPGMMMGGLSAGGRVAAAVGKPLAEAGGRLAQGVGMSALNGFLSDDGDVGQRANAATRDAAVALPFGLAGEAAQAVGPALDRGGIAMRAANARDGAGSLNAIRQNQGLEHMQSGVDQDFADLGLASNLLPQSAYGVAKKLGTPESPGMIQQAGQQMGGALDAAGDAGVRGSWDSVRGLMDNSARAELGRTPSPTAAQHSFADELGRISRDELPQPGSIQMNQDPSLQLGPAGRTQSIPGLNYDAIPGGAPMAGRLNEPFTPPSPDVMPQGNLGAPVRQMSRPTMQPGEDWLAPVRNAADEATPRELQGQKNAFEAQGYPPPGTVSLQSDAPRADAYRAAAGAPRAELQDAMQSQSFNDHYPDFNQGRQVIEKATPIADMAGARAASNKANSGLTSPMTWGPALAGAGVGGAAAGIPGAMAGAAVGGAANFLGRNYGQDLAGMGMRGAGQSLEGLGGAMAQGAARTAGPASGMMGATPPDHSNGLPGTTRGYLMPQAAKQKLQQDPMFFGQYTQQFQQAQQSGDEGELVRLLDRLDTTDPKFAPYAQQLRAMTGQMGGM